MAWLKNKHQFVISGTIFAPFVFWVRYFEWSDDVKIIYTNGIYNLNSLYTPTDQYDVSVCDEENTVKL